MCFFALNNVATHIHHSRTLSSLSSSFIYLSLSHNRFIRSSLSFARAFIAPSVSRSRSSVCLSVGVRQCVYRRLVAAVESVPCAAPVWDDAAGTHGRGRVDALFPRSFDTIFFNVLTTGRADVASRARGAFTPRVKFAQ